MRRLSFIFWLLTGAIGFASALEGGSGLLYGPGFSFWLTAPPGWIIDNKAGVGPQGSDAVFYPKGQTWEDAPVVFYTNSRSMSPQEQTPAQAAHNDIATFHAHGSPGYTGNYSETWTLPHGGRAEVWRFWGGKWGNYEAIAYVPVKKTINFIVITARTQKLFDAAFPSFRQLVLSFEQFNGKVQIEKAPQPANPSGKP